MDRDDEREQGHDNSRATPEGVRVVAAFAVELMSLTWIGVAIVSRVAGVVYVLNVLGDLFGPVVHRKRTAVSREENDGRLTQRHRRRHECVVEVMR